MHQANGRPTFHGRVESWECDFNGHWNTRFYCRSFQTAAEVAAALDGRPNRDEVVVTGRHMRFHRELLCNEAFAIGSFVQNVAGTAVTVHHLHRHGQMLATSVDDGLPPNATLPPLPGALAARVGPRGLTGLADAWRPDPEAGDVIELGPVRHDEVAKDGTLEFNAAIARLGPVSHHVLAGLGFTHEFTVKTGIGRMLVELRYRRLGPCGPQDFLRGSGRLVASGGKSFVTANLLSTHRGTPVALFETCLLAVDLGTRRATEVPAFVLRTPP
ncbi:thioesterase family protein [Antarctobacter sp.]|uniref:thioesterase family protein n=1 Tax=Antarctobacter sp. TaxID=1872577 RepID=UPI003A959898